jgi:predicted phosphodiesterase
VRGTKGMTYRIGIISDTHGLLRPEAKRRLAGVDHIIHGGDIGHPDIIDALRHCPGHRDSGKRGYRRLGRRVSGDRARSPCGKVKRFCTI